MMAPSNRSEVRNTAVSIHGPEGLPPSPTVKSRAGCLLHKPPRTERFRKGDIVKVLPNRHRSADGRGDEVVTCYCCASDPISDDGSPRVVLIPGEETTVSAGGLVDYSLSDAESLSDCLDMPVESNSNSVLKTSFSLTSLRPCTESGSPEQGMRVPIKNERLYHSLTKQPRHRHRQLDKETWRKSWGSVDGQDENPLSEAFQANYDYLMSQHILEKDSDDKGNPMTPTAPLGWSLSELNDQYARLCSWLSGIRDSINFTEENVADWKSRAERQESLQRERYRLDNFNEESARLIERFPQHEPEISHYVKFINKLWESVESLSGGLRVTDGQRRKEEESRESVKNRIRCLRKWMRELKTKLKPLNFQRTWTKPELEKLAEEHGALHRDVEAHGYVLSSVVKLCEKVDPSSLVAARALQRKYYEYLLRSFEWKCYIETLQPNKSPITLDDSDGEPGAKKLKFDHDRETTLNGSKQDLGSPDHDPSRDAASEETSRATFTSVMVGAHIVREKDHSGTFINSTPPRSDTMKSETSTAQRTSTGGANANTASNASPRTTNRQTVHCMTVTTDDPTDELRSTVGKQKTATIVCKHIDTEQENSEDEDKDNDKENTKDSVSASSEDGSTCASGGGRSSEPVSDMKSHKLSDFDLPRAAESKSHKYLSARSVALTSWNARQNSKESIIKELVDRADEMVRSRSTNSLEAKSPKSRLRSKGTSATGVGDPESKTLDSYDASSEYTAEESDDVDGSVSLLSPRSGSAEGLPNDSATRGYVVMRSSRHKSGSKTRPSSMSCVPSILGQRINATARGQLSVSESALNQMSKECGFSPGGGREKKLQWTEDGGCGGGSGSGSLRRPRRIRARKRSILNRRSDSWADNSFLNGSDSPQATSSPNKQLTTCLKGLVKSDSFSGIPVKPADPRSSDSSGSASGTETDEDVTTRLSAPVFKLGPDGGEVTVAVVERTKIEGEEQLSLNSDQVDWDDYQEKYQSEAYSEDPPDPDLVKTMTEFGEDYRKYLDSQSDCEETRKMMYRQKMSSRSSRFAGFDDCDAVLPSSPIYDDSTSVHDLFLHCQGGLDGCNALHGGRFVGGDAVLLRSLRKKWDPSRSSHLKEEMTFIKCELRRLGRLVDETETTVTTKEELETKIEHLKGIMNEVRELKSKLRPLNCSVHRFLLDTGQHAFSLKEDVEDLYLVWRSTFDEISSKLCTLQRTLQTWLEYEELLSQFQFALLSDRASLQTLEHALCDTAAYNDLGLSVSEVAKVFEADADAEAQYVSDSGVVSRAKQSSLAGSVGSRSATEGSLSDSGISDSGSEQGMTEREKKLIRLKKLQKQLETVLSPGNPALVEMAGRIEKAEAELRRLQRKCREIIGERGGPAAAAVAAAAAAAASTTPEKADAITTTDFKALPEALGLSRRLASPSSAAGATTDGEPEDETIIVGHNSEDVDEADDNVDNEYEDDEDDVVKPRGYPSTKSWIWRVIRAALPFHIALVALLCVAYALEPRCCDNFAGPFPWQIRNRHPPPT